jgi:hypothetical protein
MRAKLPLLTSLAVLLLLAVLAARGTSAVPHGRGLVFDGGGAASRPPPTGSVPSALPGRLNPVVAFGISSVVVLALLAYLVGMLVLVVVLATVRFRRRRRRSHERLADTGDEAPGGAATALVLLRGTRSALERLRQRTGGPPSDAVQRAWLALEEAAAESGTRRRPEQTSTEFTGTLLADHEVDPTALATLRGLYQRARFGHPDAVTEADADAAIAALDRIADTLLTSASASGLTDVTR